MTRTECAAFLRQKDNFCILTHADPDGDALGSAAGLCLGLRALGKTAFVLENPQTPANLQFLCEGLTVAAPAENATLVSVDVAILVLGQTGNFTITSEVVVAETVIVGDVPNTFLQTGGNYEPERKN